MMKRLLFVLVCLFPSLAFAKGKTLIEMNGGKPTAALAKSWKKIGEGKYDFVLDTAAEVAPGKKLTPALAKSSLEEKLASSGIKVTTKGASGISIVFTGTDKDFLDKLSKTRIKSGADVEVALEGSGSEGGIRAKTADRPPAVDEVKGVVVSLSGTSCELRVTAAGKSGEASKVTEGAKIKVNLPANFTPVKGDTIYVKPTGQVGESWNVSAASKT